MYNLLIVDDEPIIVDGLVQLFSELDLGLELYAAYSATEALELALTIKVDIIITDMRMPKKTGLQLIDELLLIWPNCRIIFLSGYDEFDYVYSAVKRNIDSYILKTEEDHVLIEAVQKSVNSIKTDRMMQSKLDMSRQKIEQAEPLLKREYLKAVFNGENVDLHRQKFAIGLESFHVSLDKAWLLVGGQLAYNHDVTYQSLLFLDELLQKELHPNLLIESCLYNKRFVLWLIQPQNTDSIFTENQTIKEQALKEYVKRYLESVQESFMTTLNVKVSFVMDKGMITNRQATERFGQVYETSEFIASFSEEMLVVDLNKDTPFYHSESRHATPKSWQDQLNQLEEHISLGEKEQSIEIIDGLFNDIVESGYTHIDITEIIFSISQLILDFLRNKALYHEVVKDQDPLFQQTIRQVPILFDSKEKVHAVVVAICNYKAKWKEDGNKKVITVINKHIRDNITGDLSLTAIAELVHFNPSYLSRFYKEHTEKNLSDVINDMRLEKARNYLIQTTKPIHEIATELGFNSPSYFTYFFKKQMNVSPQRYREREKM